MTGSEACGVSDGFVNERKALLSLCLKEAPRRTGRLEDAVIAGASVGDWCDKALSPPRMACCCATQRSCCPAPPARSFVTTREYPPSCLR